MSADDNGPTLVTLTREDVLAQYHRVMDSVPYTNIAEFRDAIRAGHPCPCTNCYDYTHPHAGAWSELTTVLWMLDVDWRTATKDTRP